MPRGSALGMVTQLPSGDETSISKKQLLARLDVCMGGRVAETSYKQKLISIFLKLLCYIISKFIVVPVEVNYVGRLLTNLIITLRVS